MHDADEGLRRAIISRVQHLSTDDGPGIRTAAFFKGCPMACRWCRHPEDISYQAELVFIPSRCIACGDCLSICPHRALNFRQDQLEINRLRCQSCGICVQACPTAALDVIGQPYSVDLLMQSFLQDRLFFAQSDGGVTFTGGEAASQQSVLIQIADRCKTAGLHTALESCLIHSWRAYRALVPLIDLWLINLKLLDDGLHRTGTGQGIWGILQNARLLSSAGARIWVRTTLVPGWSDVESNLRAIAELIRDQLPTVERWELIPWTRRADHYRAQGEVFEQPSADELRPERLQALAELAGSLCGRPIPIDVHSVANQL